MLVSFAMKRSSFSSMVIFRLYEFASADFSKFHIQSGSVPCQQPTRSGLKVVCSSVQSG